MLAEATYESHLVSYFLMQKDVQPMEEMHDWHQYGAMTKAHCHPPTVRQWMHANHQLRPKISHGNCIKEAMRGLTGDQPCRDQNPGTPLQRWWGHHPHCSLSPLHR